jgi:hypothetical protein
MEVFYQKDPAVSIFDCKSKVALWVSVRYCPRVARLYQRGESARGLAHSPDSESGLAHFRPENCVGWAAKKRVTVARQQDY